MLRTTHLGKAKGEHEQQAGSDGQHIPQTDVVSQRRQQSARHAVTYVGDGEVERDDSASGSDSLSLQVVRAALTSKGQWSAGDVASAMQAGAEGIRNDTVRSAWAELQQAVQDGTGLIGAAPSIADLEQSFHVDQSLT